MAHAHHKVRGGWDSVGLLMFFPKDRFRTLQWKGGPKTCYDAGVSRNPQDIQAFEGPMIQPFSTIWQLQIGVSQEDHPTGAAENHAPKNGQEDFWPVGMGSWGIKGEMCPELLPMLC